MKKLLEQRKREKAEEKEARQRVKAQIEADKAARRAKAAEGTGQSVNAASTLPALPAISSSSTMHRKDYTETRLQVIYIPKICIMYIYSRFILNKFSA